jgi:hypothetical protein
MDPKRAFNQGETGMTEAENREIEDQIALDEARAKAVFGPGPKRFEWLVKPLDINNELRERKLPRVFIFAAHEGAYREVWMDPDGEYYRTARDTGHVEDTNSRPQAFSRKVNWIASAVIDADWDFTLQAPRETA